MEKAVLFGVMDEILMKAKILRERLKSNPDSVQQILEQIEKLEDELFDMLIF